MKKIRLKIALFIAICLSSFAYKTYANADLTLRTAVKNTLQYHPQLQQLAIKARQAQNIQAMASLKPAYSIDISVKNVAGSKAFSGFKQAETTLALSSILELGDKRESRIQLAHAQIDQLSLQRKIETIDLLSSLTQLYIASLSLSERHRLAQESVGLYGKLLKTIKKRVDKGIAPEVELIRVSSELMKEQLKRDALQSKLLINYHALAAYWGERSPSYDHVQGDLYQLNTLMDFDELFKQLEHSPHIALYASKTRLKQAEVALSKTKLHADMAWHIGIKQFQSTDDTALIAGFSVPLGSKKRYQANYQNAQYALEAVDLAKAQALRQLHQQLFSAYTQLKQAASAQQKIQKDMIPQLEKALRLILKGYERGRFTYQDIVSAQRELLSAKLIRVEHATIAQLNHSIIEQLIARPLKKRLEAPSNSGY